MFQAEAGGTARLIVTRNANSLICVIGITVYAISDEQGARKKVLDEKGSGQPAMNSSKQAGMDRKAIAAWLPIFAFVTIHFVQAQEPTKVFTIGFLATGSPSTDQPYIDSFRQGLRDLGYIEGKNIVIEWRYAEGKLERASDLASDLVRLKVAILVAGTTPAALAAQKATRTIPIVFAIVADPIGAGLVDTLAKPGGNVTGATTINSELVGKRLEIFKEVVPRASVLAFLLNPADVSNVIALKDAESPAQALGIRLRPFEVRDLSGIEHAFSVMTLQGARALYLAAGTLTLSHRGRIVDLAAKSRLPTMYGSSDFVAAGGLMSYAANFAERYHRAAVYVDKILKGAKPAALPVEQPTKFEFIINLKAAKQIGLTIPPNVLARADKVIK
jgi:putative ABC transport system substrate-binding protein